MVPRAGMPQRLDALGRSLEKEGEVVCRLVVVRGFLKRAKRD
jgi:hypothetical protein